MTTSTYSKLAPTNELWKCLLLSIRCWLMNSQLHIQTPKRSDCSNDMCTRESRSGIELRRTMAVYWFLYGLLLYGRLRLPPNLNTRDKWNKAFMIIVFIVIVINLTTGPLSPINSHRKRISIHQKHSVMRYITRTSSFGEVKSKVKPTEHSEQKTCEEKPEPWRKAS